MSFDTKYRPVRFEDVLGQDASVRVLRELVKQGRGRHQSYVFAGPHGSGKTTLARILARALLCEDPVDGAPCDKCESCRSILETGTSEGFVEIDAATKTGKDNVTQMVADADYSTTTGTGRIYLIDESHRLSNQAKDALLKPMEDNAPGTTDKRIVCIFCTTEPEKMSPTIFSRCAPAFTIRVCPPELIAERLAYVCEQEGLDYEKQALVTIAEVNKSHIRPSLKTVESMADLGAITQEAVASSLQLDNINRYLKILAFIGHDLPAALALVEELNEVVSPATVYSRLSEAALLAYKTHLGVAKPYSYWHPQFMRGLGKKQGERLLTFANLFASRPNNTTMHMVMLDISRLHHAALGTLPLTDSSSVVVQVPSKGTSSSTSQTQPAEQGKVEASAPSPTPAVSNTPKEAREVNGVYVDPRAVNRRDKAEPQDVPTRRHQLDDSTFRAVLSDHLAELKDGIGFAGRHELGGPGTDTNG